MWVHLLHWRVLNTVVIIEEGKFPHPRCARCYMLFPRQALNGWHSGTAQYNKGAERKRQRLAEVETRESTEQDFEFYGTLIKM